MLTNGRFDGMVCMFPSLSLPLSLARSPHKHMSHTFHPQFFYALPSPFFGSITQRSAVTPILLRLRPRLTLPLR